MPPICWTCQLLSPHTAPPLTGRPDAGQPSADPKTFGSGKNDTVLSSPTRKEREELERRSEFFPARERAAGECHGSVGLTGLSRKRLAGLRQDLSFLDHYGQEEVASIYFFPNQIGKETP